MVVDFAQVLLVAIVLFGVYGFFRGIRWVALTTGAIFFAVVVVVFSGDLLMRVARDFGLALTTLDTRAQFNIVLFIVAVLVASRVFARVSGVPNRAQTRAQRLWGFLLGLLNGFLIMAVIEHFLNDILLATARSTVSVGMPAFSFSHPNANTWTVKLTSSSFTLLPTATNDLWAKLPVALLLLLLFLAFAFAGTVYGRVRGRTS